MAKQSQVTIPLTSLTVGPKGPFTSGTLPSTLSGYIVDLTNDTSWPAAGDVLTIKVEVSNDNGQSWQFDASMTLAGGAWTDRQGVTVHSSPWQVSIANTGSTTRKVRVSLNVLQPCTLGATLSSL